MKKKAINVGLGYEESSNSLMFKTCIVKIFLDRKLGLCCLMTRAMLAKNRMGGLKFDPQLALANL